MQLQGGVSWGPGSLAHEVHTSWNCVNWKDLTLLMLITVGLILDLNQSKAVKGLEMADQMVFSLECSPCPWLTGEFMFWLFDLQNAVFRRVSLLLSSPATSNFYLAYLKIHSLKIVRCSFLVHVIYSFIMYNVDIFWTSHRYHAGGYHDAVGKQEMRLNYRRFPRDFCKHDFWATWFSAFWLSIVVEFSIKRSPCSSARGWHISFLTWAHVSQRGCVVHTHP